jgi:hypothetical protein
MGNNQEISATAELSSSFALSPPVALPAPDSQVQAYIHLYSVADKSSYRSREKGILSKYIFKHFQKLTPVS